MKKINVGKVVSVAVKTVKSVEEVNPMLDYFEETLSDVMKERKTAEDILLTGIYNKVNYCIGCNEMNGKQGNRIFGMLNEYSLRLIEISRTQKNVDKLKIGAELLSRIAQGRLSNRKILELVEKFLCDKYFTEHSLDSLILLLHEDENCESSDKYMTRKLHLCFKILRVAEENHFSLKADNPDGLPILSDNKFYLKLAESCNTAVYELDPCDGITYDDGTTKTFLDIRDYAIQKAMDFAANFPEMMEVGDLLRENSDDEEALECYNQAEIRFYDRMTDAERKRWVEAYEKVS